MLHGASSDSYCLRMSYSESTECCFRSSLEVTTPVTLSWQQLCVFVRTPRVITKPSGSYYTQTHSSEVAAFCSVEESNNHSLLGEYCKNIDEILIGNGWNDREDREVSCEATRGNQKEEENEEGVWDSDAGTSEGAFLSDDRKPDPEVPKTKLFLENRNEHLLALPSARPIATLKCASDARVGTKKLRENQADGLKQSVSDHGVVYQSSTAEHGHTHHSQTVAVVGNQNENHPSDGREELPSSDANITLLVKDIANYAMPSRYTDDIRNGSEVDLARETGPGHGEMTIVPHQGPECSLGHRAQSKERFKTKVQPLAYRRRVVVHWKSLLRDVTGIVRPGTLLAVVGPSGAGKSTLIKALLHQPAKGCYVTGKVFVNGVPVKEQIRELSAHVQRRDLFLADLTVKETLSFRATLKLGGWNNHRMVARVLDILADMELEVCANKLVGCPGTRNGISDGEAKRLSLACEMVHNPALIFCEDLTTGLQGGSTATAAESAARVLQKLAYRQHVVICTVRQPTFATFAHFHKVLLLTEGRVAFMGTPAEALGFFSDMGDHCPHNVSPADFFVQHLDFSATQEDCAKRRAQTISYIFEQTARGQAILNEVHSLARSARATSEGVMQRLLSAARRPTTWFLQFRVNYCRFLIVLLRRQKQLRQRAAAAFLVSLVLGGIFFRLDRRLGGGAAAAAEEEEEEDKESQVYDQTSVLDVNGALFCISVVCGFLQCHSVLALLHPWIAVVLADHGRRLYRLDSFYLAANLAEIPIDIVMPLMVVSVDYWMVGLRRDVSGFLVAAWVVVLSANTAASFGHFLSTATEDGASAVMWAGPAMLPFVLLAGFFLNDGCVVSWLSWARYLSWFRHAHELLMVNQWSDVATVRCPGIVTNTNTSTTTTSSSSSSSSSSYNNGSRCLFTNGTDVLEQFHFSAENKVLNYLLLAVLLGVYRIAAFLSLVARARRSRV